MKVIKEIWCSDKAEVLSIKDKFGGQYQMEIQDLTWADALSGFKAYQKARNEAISKGYGYFCIDKLFGTRGIVEMSRRTGDSFYEIRRSILRGWKSSNGHKYERLYADEQEN